MIRNLTELVVLIENQLGWFLPDTMPSYRARAIEVAKLKAALGLTKKETVPQETLDRLEATVHFLQHKRETVRSPIGVLYHVEEAHRRQVRPKPARPLDQLIEQAVRFEMAHEAPGWEDWTAHLSRAFGDFRQEVYDTWLEERGPR